MRISDWSSDVCSSDLDLVDSSESSEDQDELKRMRASALRDYTKARRQVARLVNEIEVLDFEIDDAEDFIRHLKQSLSDFRSEERRVGKECVSTCRSLWSPDH